MRVLWLAARLAIVGLVSAVAILSTTSPTGPTGFVSLPYAAMGAVLVIRRPGTSIGWILLGLGACYALIALPVTAQPQQFADGSIDPLIALFAIIHLGLPTTLFFLYAVLVLVFPSGRLPGGRWGRLGRIALGAGLAVAAAAYFMPEIPVGGPGDAWVRNPAALLPDLSIWRVINPGTVIIPDMILVLAGAVSMIVRARRAIRTERQQLRWIAASFAFVTSAVASGFLIGSLVPDSVDSGLAWLPAMVAFPSVPIAVAVAVLRYRLYDIDRIISRTIGYAVVTAVLAAVFLATNLVLQTWVAGVTGGSTVAVAVTTLLAAALFHPLRRVTQAPIDRRFNRARVDAERTLASFGDRVRDEVQLARLSSVVVETADEAVRPAAAGLWLRGTTG